MLEQAPSERLMGIGFLASLIASLIAGIGARIIMRIVTVTAHMPPSLTIAGTFHIVFLGLLLGIVPGFVYALCIFFLSSSTKVSKHLPSSMWRGLAFGVLLLVIVGLPAVLIPWLPQEDLNLGIPLLNKSMFAALPLIYGITLGVAEKIFDHYLPRRPISTKTDIPTPQKKEDNMLHRTFWTQRRFSGLVLILGGVLFLASAWIPLTIGTPTPLTDSKGTAIYLLSPQAMLGVVLHHQMLWWWTNVFFMGSTLVTLLGLALLTTLLRQAGDHIFSYLGLILFVLGASLWLIQRAVPLSIDPWAAQQMARTGVTPNCYVPLTLWTQALFIVYSILAYCALAAYGGAILSTRLLPRWMGWLAIVYSLAGLGLTVLTAGAAPGPWLQYVLPIVMGILLLLRRNQVPTRSHREEASIATETSAVS